MDLKINNKLYDDSRFDFYDLQSELYSWGYNVQSDGLTKNERHFLIRALIKYKLMDEFSIERDLLKNLKNFRKMPFMDMALEKWERDLEFLKSIT